MKFGTELRDPVAAKALIAEIASLAADQPERKFMEVCGGHTHAIYRHGIESLLPESIEMVHGPGCPVCVIPMGRIDDAIALASQDGVTMCCFGDMMRVPGGDSTLLEAKAMGADVRVVYSPLDALAIAEQRARVAEVREFPKRHERRLLGRQTVVSDVRLRIEPPESTTDAEIERVATDHDPV